MSYINRIIEKRISLFLKIFGGISIEGPRGCGKSTTALFFAKSSFFVHENINRIEEIKKDTGIFINGETPRLIDE
jgi:serine kinase of HPr protein (carbohydrate metabolism regulator)